MVSLRGRPVRCSIGNRLRSVAVQSGAKLQLSLAVLFDDDGQIVEFGRAPERRHA